MGLLLPLLLAVSHVVSPLLSPLYSCTAAACFTWNQNLTSCFSRFVQTIQTVPVAFVIRAYSKMYKHFIYRQGRWQYRSTKYDHSVCKTPEMTQKYNWKKKGLHAMKPHISTIFIQDNVHKYRRITKQYKMPYMPNAIRMECLNVLCAPFSFLCVLCRDLRPPRWPRYANWWEIARPNCSTAADWLTTDTDSIACAFHTLSRIDEKWADHPLTFSGTILRCQQAVNDYIPTHNLSYWMCTPTIQSKTIHSCIAVIFHHFTGVW